MVLSTVLVVGYVVLLILVAARARTAREYEDFSIANRSLPLALVFGSLCATYVGPGFSIGFVGRGYNSGFLFLFIGVAYAVQNILVGLLIAPKLRELKGCYTLGDAIGQKYGSRCQLVAGIISVLLCTLFASVMISAGGRVLESMLGLEKWVAVVVVAVVTTSYTTFGGLRASVITDAYHFALHAFLFAGILLYVLLTHSKGGAASFAQEAFAATSHGFQTATPLEIVTFVIAFLLGETLIPPYANLALASKTTKVSRDSFVLAGGFAVVWFVVMIAIGVVARPLVAADVSEDSILLKLVKATVPHAGYTVMMVALLSVILSSLDSLLNAGAVVFTQDVLRRFTLRRDSAALTAGRYSTIIIAAVGSGLAVFVPSVIKGLLVCYGIWAPAILPALIIGLWSEKPRPLAAFLSMIVGTVVGAAVGIVFLASQQGRVSNVETPAIVPALVCSLAAYLIGHHIQRYVRRADR
ncbi:MAG TPA: sodium:solute symporter family protein [Sedimentisphaerales bacterium]|nr:sodium:solute symporter family protein [Sedimentisphaerales bacterium]